MVILTGFHCTTRSFLKFSFLEDKTAATLILHLKSIFAWHNIPIEIVGDNMPFTSVIFKRFTHEWWIKLNPNSPCHLQAYRQWKISSNSEEFAEGSCSWWAWPIPSSFGVPCHPFHRHWRFACPVALRSTADKRIALHIRLPVSSCWPGLTSTAGREAQADEVLQSRYQITSSSLRTENSYESELKWMATRHCHWHSCKPALVHRVSLH